MLRKNSKMIVGKSKKKDFKNSGFLKIGFEYSNF